MSETLPTVKVVHKTNKIELIINEKDFDASIYEKVGEKKHTKAEIEALVIKAKEE